MSSFPRDLEHLPRNNSFSAGRIKHLDSERRDIGNDERVNLI
jgi:hypothetical protein